MDNHYSLGNIVTTDPPGQPSCDGHKIGPVLEYIVKVQDAAIKLSGNFDQWAPLFDKLNKINKPNKPNKFPAGRKSSPNGPKKSPTCTCFPFPYLFLGT